MSTEDLGELERIVQQDISEWPSYAQVLYLQIQRVGRKVDTLVHTIEGDSGVKDTVKDHERRLKLLESIVKWAAGIGTAVVTALAVAVAIGKHP